MIIWSEVRGVLVLAATVAAIVALFVYIPTTGDDQNFYDETSATTTTEAPATTTTQAPLLTGLGVVGDLCDLAQQFADGANSEFAVYPGKMPQLAQEFYDQAYDLAVGDVRAEYAAARSYYQDYNTVAGSGNYDELTILRGPDAARFRQLATREPPGVETTRINITFLCEGLEIPRPPIISAEDFEEFEKIIEDEDEG